MDLLVEPDSLPEGQNAHGRVPLLQDMAERAEVGVVKQASVANGMGRRPDIGLGSVNGLALNEVETVEASPAALTRLARQLNPLGILHALPASVTRRT